MIINTRSEYMIFVALSALLVASTYSSIAKFEFVSALIKKGDVACISSKDSNGTTKETCCHTETDTQTGVKTNNCTECITLKDGTDMGCTHTQTNMSFTSIPNQFHGFKSDGTLQSTGEPSNKTGVMKEGSVLKSGGAATTGNNNNNTIISRGSNRTTGNDIGGKIMTLRPPISKHELSGNNTQG